MVRLRPTRMHRDLCQRSRPVTPIFRRQWQGDVPAKDVISRAAAGDPVAEGIFSDAITALGRALVNYVLLMTRK